MTWSVGVFGLGSMGGRIAATLARAGFDVLGVDPSSSAEIPGVLIERPARVFRSCDVLVLSLPSSVEVEKVLTGSGGLLDQEVEHRLVVDTSTSDPLSTRALEQRLAAAGHSLVDAPVSGGPSGAENGALTVFLGGSAEAAAEAGPVLDALARSVVHVGTSGAGNVAKLLNNLLCAAHLQIAGEALRLAEAAGLDLGPLVEALNTASGRSAVSEINLPQWVLSSEFDSGFTVGLMSRDVDLALATSRQLNLNLPLASMTSRTWQAARNHWGQNSDFNRVADPQSVAYWDDLEALNADS